VAWNLDPTLIEAKNPPKQANECCTPRTLGRQTSPLCNNQGYLINKDNTTLTPAHKLTTHD